MLLHKSPFLYVDCDTKWRMLPDKELALLADSTKHTKPCFVMYELDGLISERFYPQYFKRSSILERVAVNHGLSITPNNWPMWNAGAIGIPGCAQGFSDAALQLNDEILPLVRLRNFVEQLAITMVAHDRFELVACKQCLDHYWNHSFELPVVLERFFKKMPAADSVEQQAHRCADFEIDEQELTSIQVLPKNRFMRWRKKVRNSFYKRKIDLKVLYVRCFGSP